MLIWDAYRNGGLHNYLPKQGTITTAIGQVRVTFGLSWPENPRPQPRFNFEQMRSFARQIRPWCPGTRHLAVEVISQA